MIGLHGFGVRKAKRKASGMGMAMAMTEMIDE